MSQYLIVLYHLCRDEADWFLKADDDSFIIMENLKSFLAEHKSMDPIQFGCKLKQHVEKGNQGCQISCVAVHNCIQKTSA